MAYMDMASCWVGVPMNMFMGSVGCAMDVKGDGGVGVPPGLDAIAIGDAKAETDGGATETDTEVDALRSVAMAAACRLAAAVTV